MPGLRALRSDGRSLSLPGYVLVAWPAVALALLAGSPALTTACDVAGPQTRATVTGLATPASPGSPTAAVGGLHEPAGMTTFIDDDGSVLVPPGMWAMDAWSGQNGWGDKHTAIVTDPTNPTGSGYAIEKRWHAGERTDAAAQPGLIAVWPWSRINPAFRPATTLYVRMRVWFSPNWPVGNAALDGVKFFYLKTSKTNTNVLWTSNGSPRWLLHWATLTPHGAPGNLFFDTWAGTLLPVGSWHTFEFVFSVNSAPDTPDGRVQTWVDGSAASDRTGIVFVGAGDQDKAPDFDGIEIYPIRGAVNNVFDRDDQLRIGELYVSGRW